MATSDREKLMRRGAAFAFGSSPEEDWGEERKSRLSPYQKVEQAIARAFLGLSVLTTGVLGASKADAAEAGHQEDAIVHLDQDKISQDAFSREQASNAEILEELERIRKGQEAENIINPERRDGEERPSPARFDQYRLSQNEVDILNSLRPEESSASVFTFQLSVTSGQFDVLWNALPEESSVKEAYLALLAQMEAGSPIQAVYFGLQGDAMVLAIKSNGALCWLDGGTLVHFEPTKGGSTELSTLTAGFLALFDNVQNSFVAFEEKDGHVVAVFGEEGSVELIADSQQVVTISPGVNVNVRGGAGTNFDIVASATGGNSYNVAEGASIIDDGQYEWLKIVIDNKEGYIATSLGGVTVETIEEAEELLPEASATPAAPASKIEELRANPQGSSGAPTETPDPNENQVPEGPNVPELVAAPVPPVQETPETNPNASSAGTPPPGGSGSSGGEGASQAEGVAVADGELGPVEAQVVIALRSLEGSLAQTPDALVDHLEQESSIYRSSVEGGIANSFGAYGIQIQITQGAAERAGMIAPSEQGEQGTEDFLLRVRADMAVRASEAIGQPITFERAMEILQNGESFGFTAPAYAVFTESLNSPNPQIREVEFNPDLPSMGGTVVFVTHTNEGFFIDDRPGPNQIQTDEILDVYQRNGQVLVSAVELPGGGRAFVVDSYYLDDWDGGIKPTKQANLAVNFFLINKVIFEPEAENTFNWQIPRDGSPLLQASTYTGLFEHSVEGFRPSDPQVVPAFMVQAPQN